MPEPSAIPMDHNGLNDFRARVVAGEEVTPEELKAAIAAVQALRAGVAETKPKAAKKSAKSKAAARKEAGDLLGDLL